MTQHEPFSFRSSEELLEKTEKLEVEIPFQDSISPLFDSIIIGRSKIPNRMVVQPMEGFDANPDGSPGELSFRRYERYAKGGSGLIWHEATSIIPQGRSNPRQSMITRKNLDSFKRLVENIRRQAYKAFDSKHEVFLVLQLTHSGRFSMPKGKPQPQAACLNPFLDRNSEKVHILSDEELDYLQDRYLQASKLAYQAGFDAVDIKACHGYLVNDLLAAFMRKDSRYGGMFDDRARFLTEVVQNVKKNTQGLVIGVRFNAYDGIKFPYGFGVKKDSSLCIDLSEPKALVKQLVKAGASFFNITAGIPRYNPHLGRPFDRNLPGDPLPEEHPLEGVSRLIKITEKLQDEFPDYPFVYTGFSWLRQFFPNVAAAIITSKKEALIGLGRSSFAYPDAVKELMDTGTLHPRKVCITCSRCTELMRAGCVTGCVVHDKEIYAREYHKISYKYKEKKNEKKHG
ncbi:MAG: hypothetical protein IBX60_07855 [Candidatus Aminicenantes bacterium]|nr:hypothetical protein [Candidatus Aminicenantes bacterium]